MKVWIQSLVIKIRNKGNLQLCKNYRIISLTTNPSKVLLKVILNRLHLKQKQLYPKNKQVFEQAKLK